MKCVRCGHCCIGYAVVIIDDLTKPLEVGNLIGRDGSSPCKHLEGDTPGSYSCKAHSHPDYEQTPCFQFGQVEATPETPCRIGEYKLRKMP